MSPLIYLLSRRIKNGFRRSFKTPVRAAMTVLMAGYVIFTFSILFAARPASAHPVLVLPDADPRIPEALLTLGHCLLLLYVLPNPKYLYAIFSETDIANLYPLPIDRWRVVRFFLFSRTFLGLFFFFGVISFYGSFALRRIIPGLFPTTDDGTKVLSFLLYTGFVLIALAGLMFWRLVLDIRREFDLIPKTAFRNTVVSLLSVIVLIVLYHTSAASRAGLNPLVGLAVAVDSIPLVVFLAPFRMLVQAFRGHIDFGSVGFWTSALVWFGIAVSGYRALRSHRRWLYEYAARIADFRVQMVARIRNPSVILKEKVEKKKVSLRLPWFLRVITPKGAGAIFWCDAIVTWRSFGAIVKGLHNILFVTVVVGGFALIWYHVPLKVERVWGMSLAVFLIGAFPLSMVSVMAFSDILRRADTQKPFPISATKTVAMHILQWTVLTCSVMLLPFTAGAMLFPSFVNIIFFVLFAGISFVYAVVSGYFLVSLFNPDQQDPIQRMYASLFGLLAAAAASLPGGAALGIGLALHARLFVVLPSVFILNLASARLFQYFSARKYANFVFSE